MEILRPKSKNFDQILLDEIRQDIHTLYPYDSSLDTTPAEWKPILLYVDYSDVTKWDAVEMVEPVIVYAHAAGCCRTNDPDFIIVSLDSIALLDKIVAKRLENIVTILESGIPTLERPKLLAERSRLEHCLGSNNKAKGVYLRRCNGEFRNSLDDEIISDLAAPNGRLPSELGYSIVDEEGPCEKKRWTYTESTWPNAVPTTFTYKKLKGELRKVAEGKISENDFLVDIWYKTRSGRRSEASLKETLKGECESRG